MGLYRRGKIFWFSIMQDGRRIQVSTETDNKKLAEAISAKIHSDIIEGKFFERQKAQTITFGEVAKRYMEKYQKQRDPHSIKHLLPYFENRTLAEITSETIESYIEKRLDEGAALSTIYKEFALGRRMLNVARKKWKWAKDNPFSDVEFPSINNERDRWLTVQEEQRLIASAEQQWLRDIIIFAIHTGCRMGEILTLTWKDIDLQRRVMTIQASKGGIKKSIPVSNTLYETLIKQSKISHISNRVFSIKRGTLKDAFETAVERARMEDFHFHDLRHSFATRLVQGGVDLYAIQKLLGHKTIRMTERYSHHYPESLRPSINVLDNCYNFATVDETDSCLKREKSSKINIGSV